MKGHHLPWFSIYLPFSALNKGNAKHVLVCKQFSFWFPGISQGYACGFELQTLQGDVHLFIKETHICFCLNFLSKPT